MLIKDIKHLKELCKNRQQLDCYVKLNGCCRSSKTLLLEEDGGVNVINEIDDTDEGFDSIEDMVKRHLTINEAIKKHSFYVFDYEVG